MAALAVAVSGVLISGCSSTSTPGGESATLGATVVSQLPTGPPPSSFPTGAGSSVATKPPSEPTVELREADRGRTVAVKVGEVVTLTLKGTDWGFTDPKPASVLTAMSPPIVAREPGTSSISFRAAKPGTATVTATKAGGDSFQVTVVVQ